MNIVILDSFLVDHGELSWDGIRNFGELTIYDSTPEELISQRVEEADIVLLNNVIFSKEKIASAKNLKFISMLATGYDNVDLEECRKRGIKVSNIPTYGTDTVAQFTFSLLLEICNNVKEHSDKIFSKDYIKKYEYSVPIKNQYELAGKTMGIIGYGNIGRKVSEIAKAFGMEVLAYRGENKEKKYEEEVSLEYLLANSDVISLHAKLTEENFGIINKDTISKMKDDVILINVARGDLIVEKDLKEALDSGKILGVGIDVLSVEPIEEDNILLSSKNLLITPHMAWTTEEARKRIIETVEENIKGFLEGNYKNLV
ncbi:D-2-hydroxyacid dehydrogenase [Peptostreptococcaceae bacterium OttesenSCG-928-C18]|nr:D-2-hydroxyacid dehydrogenase [Peptostreptococcaceae bacterium OttesenSCG-928-C18]